MSRSLCHIVQTTLEDRINDELNGSVRRIALLMVENSKIKIVDIVGKVGLTRDGVNYNIRKLKKSMGLRRVGSISRNNGLS